MDEDFILEFLVTVIAILTGLVVGKWVSRKFLYGYVPIAVGDPDPKPLGVAS